MDGTAAAHPSTDRSVPFSPPVVTNTSRDLCGNSQTSPAPAFVKNIQVFIIDPLSLMATGRVRLGGNGAPELLGPTPYGLAISAPVFPRFHMPAGWPENPPVLPDRVRSSPEAHSRANWRHGVNVQARPP